MNNKKADGGLKTKMHLNHILPIPTINHPISAPSFRRVTTIKHCCPSRKPRSFMTSPFALPTSISNEAIAQQLKTLEKEFIEEGGLRERMTKARPS